MILQQELKKRFEIDQKFSKGRKWNELKNVYYKNTIWLKDLIDRIGWPSQNLVGIMGEQSAWLIAQHSLELKFQERCLNLIKTLPQTNERKQYIAYLTDSILVKKGEKQIYGTQFYRNEKGKLIPLPIRNFENLEGKRKQVGLESFIKYKLRMQE